MGLDKNTFAIFILTHGRSDRVITYNTLLKHGYTGDIYLLVDDEDREIDKYKETYGEKVVVFSKSDIAKQIDVGDNFKDKAAVIYARNACFDVAKKLGYKYFMELDDDYTTFTYKFNNDLEYCAQKDIKDLDKVIGLMIEFFEKTGCVDLAMAQNGDFIGGGEGSFGRIIQLRRKCMNTHLLSTERRFRFVGKINEDVNTPLVLGAVGKLFFTFPMVAINQIQTQANRGGLTDIYLDRGTYVKSFYSVIYTPSCVKITLMGETNRRLHHRVSWNNAVPKIIHEKHRKKTKETST